MRRAFSEFGRSNFLRHLRFMFCACDHFSRKLSAFMAFIIFVLTSLACNRMLKVIHAFAVEANPISSGVGRAFPCYKADSVVFAKGLPSSCPDSGRAT